MGVLGFHDFFRVNTRISPARSPAQRAVKQKLRSVAVRVSKPSRSVAFLLLGTFCGVSRQVARFVASSVAGIPTP